MYRYANLLPFGSPHELDELLEERIDFQLLSDDDIPSTVWEKASISLDDGARATYHRLDLIWHHLSTMKAPDGTHRFNRLCLIAKLVMVIPHSNEQEERVFSMIRKNKTCFRPSLDPKGTLSSILSNWQVQEMLIRMNLQRKSRVKQSLQRGSTTRHTQRSELNNDYVNTVPEQQC